MDTARWPTDRSEPCGRPDCRHPLTNHLPYGGCNAPFAGEGPAIPDARCTCESFDASAFIARSAQVAILREMADRIEKEAREARREGFGNGLIWARTDGRACAGEDIAADLRAKAGTLEAGAGQTGTTS